MAIEAIRFNAGDSASWLLYAPEYLPPTWSVTAWLAKESETPIAVLSVASGEDHHFSISPEVTEGMAPGTYTVTYRATDGTTTATIGQILATVLPDPSKAYDRRTHNEKALALITAALEGRLSSVASETLIDGVQLKYLSPSELLALRDKYVQRVRLERGGPIVRTIPVRLVSPYV